MIGTDDGFETEVTGFRQRTAQRLRGRSATRAARTDVGEFVGEACACMDFQQELGQVDAWQQRPHLAQGEATGRFVQACPGQWYQRVTALDAFHTHRVMRGKLAAVRR